jgi:hypothetical protein
MQSGHQSPNAGRFIAEHRRELGTFRPTSPELLLDPWTDQEQNWRSTMLKCLLPRTILPGTLHCLCPFSDHSLHREQILSSPRSGWTIRWPSPFAWILLYPHTLPPTPNAKRLRSFSKKVTAMQSRLASSNHPCVKLSLPKKATWNFHPILPLPQILCRSLQCRQLTVALRKAVRLHQPLRPRRRLLTPL